ncbi:hypothetical protein [Photobacterium damselae]|uniref:hypothetical protein n=1 Tax=Photobacterium damselae TaxID=38293 RepID=UPI001F223CE4|nr:hypothetical protein [Photobacterium damselae]UKA12806.1 hypothetical protein IHC91_21170 [Photobacterium damselae subsp. damselae]
MMDPMLMLELQEKLYNVADNISSTTDPIKQLELLDEMDQLIQQIMGSATSQEPKSDELLEKYRAGGFNNEPSDDFKNIMAEVSSAGMPLNEVGDGVISWFENNPEQLAA